MTPSVPASSLRILVEGLSALGLPPAVVASRLAIPSGTLEGDEALTLAQAGGLLDLALSTGGSGFGVRAGGVIPVGRLGLVDHLCGAAPTVDAALRDLERYFALVATGVTLTWDGRALLLELPAVPLAHRRVYAEITFAVIEQRMAARSGRPLDATPSFPWSAPPHAEAVRAVWPGTRFEAGDCRLSIPPERAVAPLLTADSSLRDLLDGYARRELDARPASPPPPNTVADRVADAVLAALPGPPPSAEAVARTLAMSTRSLRRALAAEGTSYTAVRDRSLRGVAERALRDRQRTLGEVAWLLGYSEPRAFHRAFRRWTGTSPDAFRRSGRTGP